MGERVNVTLVCTECSARNYKTTRKPTQKGPIELKKHCTKCNRHTVHRESK